MSRKTASATQRNRTVRPSAEDVAAAGPLTSDLGAIESDQTSSIADLASAKADGAALDRDDAAANREEISTARDAAADARDLAAEKLELAHEPAEGEDEAAIKHAGELRAQASDDREFAATDRKQAAVDRAGATLDRERAAIEREHAAIDREHAAIDRRQARTELERAHKDDLTGAFRRGAGLAVLQQEMDRADRSGETLVLAFVDADGLKSTNDDEGHAAGDARLRDLVSALRSKIRSYEPIVRYGGDEFLCSFVGVGTADVKARFDEINVVLGGRDHSGSMSVGLSELQAGDTLQELIDRADQALNESRGTSRTV
ncbi:MAG: GGDEF domain-containing protein [Solirubrobacterales bacterium]